jgi:hypothetical protein
MKKTLLLLALIVLGVSLSACVDLTQVTSIELNWTPAIEYVLDDEVLLDDKEVTINFETGNPLVVTIDNDDIEKVSGIVEESGSYYLDTSELGTFTLKIGYQGSTVSIQYRVVEGEPVPTTVNNDTELRALLSTATGPVVATLGASFALTDDINYNDLLSINTGAFELDLGGFSVNVNAPVGEDDFLENSFAFTGSFVNGFVNLSSVFENTPDVGYLLTNSAVADEAVFDAVVLPTTIDQASFQALIDDANVTILLLQEGTYTLTQELTWTENGAGKKAALFINTETMIIGAVDNLGAPTSKLTANNQFSNAILFGGANNISIYNVEMSGYDKVYTKLIDEYTYTTGVEGSVLYSLGSVHGAGEFTGTLVLDNIVFEEFMKNAMAFYGGEIYLLNSILDATDKNDKDVHIVNGIQSSVDAVIYVDSNYFDGFMSHYPEDFPEDADQYASAAVYTVYGGTIATLRNNIITNSQYGFTIDNYWALSNQPSTQGKFSGVFEDFISGNTLFDNEYNLFVYSAIYDVDYIFSYYSTLYEMISKNNEYPRFDDYENAFVIEIWMYSSIELDESVAMEQGALFIYDGISLTIADGVVLTLSDVGRIIVYEGGSIEESSLDFFAWYLDGTTKYYVGSVDLIPDGTEYTTYEGVVYTKD